MADSQVNDLIQVRDCLLFLLKCPELKTYKYLILYLWYSCLARLFSATYVIYLFLFLWVTISSLLSPWVSLPLSAFRLPIVHEAFSPWISNFQLLKIFPLWEINTGRHLISIPIGLDVGVGILVNTVKVEELTLNLDTRSALRIGLRNKRHILTEWP